MNRAAVIDVSDLAPGAFGYRGMLWWGAMGMVLVESVAFAITIGAYFYLRTRVQNWPPSLLPPDLRWGTLNAVVLLLSAIPNYFAKNAAENVDLPKVRFWLVVCIVFGSVVVTVHEQSPWDRLMYCPHNSSAASSPRWPSATVPPMPLSTLQRSLSASM